LSTSWRVSLSVKVLKTKLTLQQINDRHIRQKILKDVKMAEDALVQGTPTIFVNGEIDRTRLKYESIK
jgi:protein-disulfide isomerase